MDEARRGFERQREDQSRGFADDWGGMEILSHPTGSFEFAQDDRVSVAREKRVHYEAATSLPDFTTFVTAVFSISSFTLSATFTVTVVSLTFVTMP